MCGDPKEEPKREITLREIIQSNNEMANLVFKFSNKINNVISNIEPAEKTPPKSPDGIRRELRDTCGTLENTLSTLKRIFIQLKDNKPSNH